VPETLHATNDLRFIACGFEKYKPSTPHFSKLVFENQDGQFVDDRRRLRAEEGVHKEMNRKNSRKNPKGSSSADEVREA
jgi:hypothetical protein